MNIVIQMFAIFGFGTFIFLTGCLIIEYVELKLEKSRRYELPKRKKSEGNRTFGGGG